MLLLPPSPSPYVEQLPLLVSCGSCLVRWRLVGRCYGDGCAVPMSACSHAAFLRTTTPTAPPQYTPVKESMSLCNKCFCGCMCLLAIVMFVLLAMIAILLVRRLTAVPCEEPCLCWESSTAPADSDENGLTVDVAAASPCVVTATVKSGAGEAEAAEASSWRQLCDPSLHLEYQWTGQHPMYMQVRCVEDCESREYHAGGGGLWLPSPVPQ